MPKLKAEQLRLIGARIFEAAGASVEEAQIVARLLANANLVGHDSHGVIRIPQYVHSIESGDIVLGAPVEIVRENPSTAVVDGNWGFGQVIASRAMEIAIEKAGDTAVSSVSVQNCNHIGRLGDYAMMATEREMIAIVVANNHGAGRNVAPWGGRERRLSTNPICVGIPTGPRGAVTSTPIVLDITSSVVAEGKVRVMRNRGEPVPAGWIIDAEGNPSTDPNDLYGPPQGAILPLGDLVGHKGFGLGLVIDILSGGLSGAGCSRPDATRIGNAILMTVYNISSFVSTEAFYRQVSDLVSYVKSSSLAPDFDEVIVPGEPEARLAAERGENGIFVEDETWSQIVASAKKLGVQLAGIIPSVKDIDEAR
ncbi:MAG: Ldh family oxidoreductase [Chloroflexi bacterium]|nr:Ldh family oxidoreductase [Chloroflexota bacterium]